MIDGEVIVRWLSVLLTDANNNDGCKEEPRFPGQLNSM